MTTTRAGVLGGIVGSLRNYWGLFREFETPECTLVLYILVAKFLARKKCKSKARERELELRNDEQRECWTLCAIRKKARAGRGKGWHLRTRLLQKAAGCYSTWYDLSWGAHATIKNFILEYESYIVVCIRINMTWSSIGSRGAFGQEAVIFASVELVGRICLPDPWASGKRLTG